MIQASSCIVSVSLKMKSLPEINTIIYSQDTNNNKRKEPVSNMNISFYNYLKFFSGDRTFLVL